MNDSLAQDRFCGDHSRFSGNPHRRRRGRAPSREGKQHECHEPDAADPVNHGEDMQGAGEGDVVDHASPSTSRVGSRRDGERPPGVADFTSAPGRRTCWRPAVVDEGAQIANPSSSRLCHRPPETRTIASPTSPDFATGGSANFEKRNLIVQPLRTIRVRRADAFARPL
jgi:hypothetical protein